MAALHRFGTITPAKSWRTKRFNEGGYCAVFLGEKSDKLKYFREDFVMIETIKNHIIIFPYDAFKGLFPPSQILSFEVVLAVVPIV